MLGIRLDSPVAEDENPQAFTAVVGVAACFTRPERPGEGSITSCDSFRT